MASEEQLDNLLAQLTQSVTELKSHGIAPGRDFPQRMKAIQAAQDLITSLKNPADYWVDLCISWGVTAAIKLFRDWKVFDEIPDEGSISYAELAKKANAEESLLSESHGPWPASSTVLRFFFFFYSMLTRNLARLAWVLVSNGLLKQVGEDQVAHTPRSKFFVDASPVGLIYQIGLVIIRNALLSFSSSLH